MVYQYPAGYLKSKDILDCKNTFFLNINDFFPNKNDFFRYKSWREEMVSGFP